MEIEEIQTQDCKFPRISYQDEEDDIGEVKKSSFGDIGKLYGWPSSRIVRVSRASGGKDRHSKVWTSKGLRDRRVRLSVNTAIQFYDLQDRLGCDQPSKAVEWLLKAAAPSIAELPPLEGFPDAQQLSDEKRSSAGVEPGFDSADVEMDDDDPNYHQQQQQQQQQPCSSNSETSKGSGLSLSRSESRIKARERAKERAVEKEKEKENESSIVAHHHQNMHHSSSFTELLAGGMNNNNNNSSNNNSNTSPIHQNTPRQWCTNPLEYFTSGLLGPSSTRGIDNSTGFSGQVYMGNPLQPLIAVSSPMFSISGDHQPELQHFPFGGNNLVPVVTANGGSNSHNNTSNEYNLNFSISRGTLQSNSSSTSPSILPHHFQRFSPIDGSQSLFLGTTMATAAAAPNAAAALYEAPLQLFYGNGYDHSDQKGKGKN